MLRHCMDVGTQENRYYKNLMLEMHAQEMWDAILFYKGG